MSIHSPITRSDNWHRFERKTFQVPVVDAAGEPVDLTGLDLQWLLLHHQGSDRVYLERTSGDFETPQGDDDDIAVWVVEESEYEDVPPRWYYYELWDRTNHLQLAHGGALLQRARQHPDLDGS